tara:strand:+ start:14466 stop:15677 length:1212 start_codon:yes stop_codon:yes gene_type:complete
MALRSLIALLGVFLFLSSAIAQNNNERFLGRMKQDDANGDGKLTRSEFTGPDRLFKQLDSDGDGIVILKQGAEKLHEIRVERDGGVIGSSNQENAGNRMQAAAGRSRGQVAGGAGRRLIEPDDQNVRYGEHERNVLDVYLAKTDSKDPAPCMIWIHGGGFRRGDKAEGSQFAKSFTENGIHFVTLNYRLSQQAIAPACFHDCARAVQFIRHHAKKWNLDKTRIAVGGGSAGSGLSQWIGYSPDRADPDSEDPVLRESTRVSALILLNAQTSYDFRWIKQHVPGDAWQGDALQQLFGYAISNVGDITDAKYRLIEDCSPLTHFSKDDPPTLFFYRRSKDPSIAVKNAMDGIHHPIFGLELKKIADESGVPCEVFTVENEDDLAFYHRRWDYTMEFLRKHFHMSP